MQALKKKHSTSEEALQVAAAAGAYRTVLTHFSQRYPKVPAGVSATGGPLLAALAITVVCCAALHPAP